MACKIKNGIINMELTKRQINLMFKQAEKFRVIDYWKKLEEDRNLNDVKQARGVGN